MDKDFRLTWAHTQRVMMKHFERVSWLQNSLVINRLLLLLVSNQGFALTHTQKASDALKAARCAV